MKTLKNLHIQNNIVVTIIASLLFLSSCKKEDLITTTSGNVTTTDAAKQQLQSKGNQTHFEEAPPVAALKAAQSIIMIKFDHIAARTYAPDYSVTIKFDGTIIFEGRRNVAYVGTKEWQLATDKFMNVKQLFDHSGFNSIEDNLSLLADVPMVSTTWCASPAQRSKTLIDYNDGYPEGLISLRQKAESILDLWQYINYLEPQVKAGTTVN